MNNVKKSIGWADYTINPVKGLCPVDCKDNQGKSYCYARRMYKRFKRNPEIRFQAGEFLSLPSEPVRVFIGSTIELFGDWINPEWMTLIFDAVKVRPQHTFIFLTKQPQNLIKWSPFPDNCWVGVTVTNEGITYPDMFETACRSLADIKASVKFVSFEPLQSSIYKLDLLKIWRISWVIIGQQTPVKKATMPKIEWIQEIVEAADKAEVPVFLKNNLRDFIYGEYGGKYKQIFKYAQDGGRELRQEFPK